MILDELAPAPASEDDPRFLCRPLEDAAECEVTELGLEVQIARTLEQRGIYSLDQLKVRKPEVHSIIKKLLGTGLIGKQEIAHLCGVAWETVAAVELESGNSLRDLKGRLCSHLSLALTAAAEGLIRRAKAGALTALDFGILVDKLLLLSGEVTQRIELVEDPVVADFRRFIQAHTIHAPGAPALEAPGMSSWGENVGQRAVIEVTAVDTRAAGTGGQAAGTGDQAAGQAPVDLESAGQAVSGPGDSQARVERGQTADNQGG